MISPQEARIRSFVSHAFDCPTQDGSTIANVIVCTAPRSGSMLLSDLLRQTELFGVPMEYLNEDYLCQWSTRNESSMSKESLKDYLSNVIRHRTTSNGVFGIKLHYHQMIRTWNQEKLSILDYFGREKTLWIHLSRRDRAAQAVSLFRATRTNHWLSTDSEQQKQAPEVPSSATSDGAWGNYSYRDILTLHQFLERETRGWSNFFRARSIEPIVIFYEDLIGSGMSKVVKDILALARTRFGELAFPDLKKPLVPSIVKQGREQDLWVQRFREDLQKPKLQRHHTSHA